MWQFARSTRGAVIIGITLALLLFSGLFISIRLHLAAPELPVAQEAQPGPIESCVEHLVSSTASEKADLEIRYQTSEVCYGILYKQMLIKDFEIRRMKFSQQYYAEVVILWMVVAITISGVFLAGLQLYVSFKLASSGRASFPQETELVAQKDKLSLKSSYVGIIILLLSFAFFYVYVFEVYRIREVDPDKSQNVRSVANEPEKVGNGTVASPIGTLLRRRQSSEPASPPSSAVVIQAPP